MFHDMKQIKLPKHFIRSELTHIYVYMYITYIFTIVIGKLKRLHTTFKVSSTQRKDVIVEIYRYVVVLWV